jgi:hypothetical protein
MTFLFTRASSASETHLFSPTLVNDFRFGWCISTTASSMRAASHLALISASTAPQTVSPLHLQIRSRHIGFQIGPPRLTSFRDQSTFNHRYGSWLKARMPSASAAIYTRKFRQTLLGSLMATRFNDSNAGSTPAISPIGKLLIGSRTLVLVAVASTITSTYQRLRVLRAGRLEGTNNLTVNLGLRVEGLGAFRQPLPHRQLDVDGQRRPYPFINGSCANKSA